MSRVGKYPVIVPEGVNVSIDGNVVNVKGKLGELSFAFDDSHVNVELNETPSIITDFGTVFKPTSIALYPV